MKLSLKSCGKTADRSGSFDIVLAVDGNPDDTIRATLTERTTGPVFGQSAAIVAELVEQLLAGINEKLAAPEDDTLVSVTDDRGAVANLKAKP